MILSAPNQSLTAALNDCDSFKEALSHEDHAEGGTACGIVALDSSHVASQKKKRQNTNEGGA